MKLGSIYTIKDYDQLKFVHRFSYKQAEECKSCDYRIYCQGGCPRTKYNVYGNYMGVSPMCPAYKELFPIWLKLAEKYKKTTSYQYKLQVVEQNNPKWC